MYLNSPLQRAVPSHHLLVVSRSSQGFRGKRMTETTPEILPRPLKLHRFHIYSSCPPLYQSGEKQIFINLNKPCPSHSTCPVRLQTEPEQESTTSKTIEISWEDRHSAKQYDSFYQSSHLPFSCPTVRPSQKFVFLNLGFLVQGRYHRQIGVTLVA